MDTVGLKSISCYKLVIMLAVRIKGLSHSINYQKILSDINLDLDKDKIACILGPSGCGKTTLLKLIAGLEKAQSGEIFLNGDVASRSIIISTSSLRSFLSATAIAKTRFKNAVISSGEWTLSVIY